MEFQVRDLDYPQYNKIFIDIIRDSSSVQAAWI